MMNDKEFSTLLESCLQWMEETGGSSVEAAARNPEYETELLELLDLSSQLNSVNLPGPTAEFKAVARTRMLNLIQASEHALAKTFVTKSPLKRLIGHTSTLTRRLSMTWIIVIGILAAALAGGGGVAYASNDALPGDALYPVKNVIQDVELAFANNQKEVRLRLTQLDINIDELETLVEEQRLDDLEEGLDEFSENFQAFLRVRARVNYEDAGTEDSINQRLQTQYQALTNLQQQFQYSDKIQTKLQTAAQLTETGMTYGPNDGGKPAEPGAPNGAGPAGVDVGGDGEAIGPGNPDQENGQNGSNGNNSGQGNGSGNLSDGGRQLNEKGCEVTDEGELCTPALIGYVCIETEEGELVCTNEHPEFGYGAYLCEKMADGEIICKPEMPRDGHFGPAAPGSGPGGSNNKKP